MSNEREFERRVITIGGMPVSVKILRCSGVGCDFEGEVIDRTHDGMPSVVLEKRFKAKGWEVGKSAKHDLCPGCVEKVQAERRKRKQGRLKVTDMSKVNGVIAGAASEPVRKMERDDRRLILSKLDAVYLDEARGYQSPWTDKKVADDLNVPLAWVAELREENFGPASDNQEIREMLDRVTANAKSAMELLHEAKAVRAEGAALVDRINDLNRRASDIGKNLDGLLTLTDRIKAAVL